MLGILGFKDGWFVKSNYESGEGYCDIIIKIESRDIGIIIEVKYAHNGEYASACKSALKQIRDGGYTADLKEDGYHMIYMYGIACHKKKCRVVLETEMPDHTR